jgi:glucose-1-phosphate cytidylyltransferase
VEVECVDSGEDTPTGGRVLAAAGAIGPGPFFLAYGDGLADIDLRALAAAHAAAGALATMTVVRPELPFGVALLDGDDRVTGFREKPVATEWVNGGFLLLEPAVLDYLSPGTMLEREPLERLAREGRLQAFRHAGFWACMDTHKDATALNALWRAGRAPWVARPGSTDHRG